MPITSNAKIWAYISNSLAQWLRQTDVCVCERERAIIFHQKKKDSYNSKRL